MRNKDLLEKIKKQLERGGEILINRFAVKKISCDADLPYTLTFLLVNGDYECWDLLVQKPPLIIFKPELELETWKGAWASKEEMFLSIIKMSEGMPPMEIAKRNVYLLKEVGLTLTEMNELAVMELGREMPK